MKTYLSIVVPVLALLTLGSCRTKQQDGPIKCMTFNIRYDNRGDSLNSWETRRDTIAKFINSKPVGRWCWNIAMSWCCGVLTHSIR